MVATRRRRHRSIYFQANADHNGTTSDAIAFHAWDQTSGINGGTG